MILSNSIHVIILNFKNSFYLMCHKQPLLILKDDRVQFQGLQSVPNILGNIYAITAVFLAEDNAFGNRAIIVIVSFPEVSQRSLLCQDDDCEPLFLAPAHWAYGGTSHQATDRSCSSCANGAKPWLGMLLRQEVTCLLLPLRAKGQKLNYQIVLR